MGIPASRLLVTPGGQRLKCGRAGRWSHRQPALAQWGIGTAQHAGCSAGTGGSSRGLCMGWELPGAGLGASPVGKDRLSPVSSSRAGHNQYHARLSAQHGDAP